MAKLIKDCVKVANDFTIIPNEILRNKEMKSSTKNILLTMFSLPPNWDFSIKGISSCVHEGYETVQKSLVELEKMGYITRKRERKQGGIFGAMIYTVHQFPVSAEDNTYQKNFVSDLHVKKPIQVKTSTGADLHVKKPVQVKSRQLRIDNIYNTDYELNTDSLYNTDIKIKDNEIINCTNENVSSGNDSVQDNDKINGINKRKLIDKDSLCVKDNTRFPRKSGSEPQKLTYAQLKSKEQDMIKRFGVALDNVSESYGELTDLNKANCREAFNYYLSKFTAETGKIHPILTDETLLLIAYSFSSLADCEYNHLEVVADSGGGFKNYLILMIDMHFSREHRQKTDWSIVHFSQQSYLEKLLQSLFRELEV